MTFLQTIIGCRLPIIQGGTFTFVTPTLAILALDKWSRECPALEDDEAWAGIDEDERREMWQVETDRQTAIKGLLIGENPRGSGSNLRGLYIPAGSWLHGIAGGPPQVHYTSHHRTVCSHDRSQPLRRGLSQRLQTLGSGHWVLLLL